MLLVRGKMVFGRFRSQPPGPFKGKKYKILNAEVSALRAGTPVSFLIEKDSFAPTATLVAKDVRLRTVLNILVIDSSKTAERSTKGLKKHDCFVAPFINNALYILKIEKFDVVIANTLVLENDPLVEQNRNEQLVLAGPMLAIIAANRGSKVVLVNNRMCGCNPPAWFYNRFYERFCRSGVNTSNARIVMIDENLCMLKTQHRADDPVLDYEKVLGASGFFPDIFPKS